MTILIVWGLLAFTALIAALFIFKTNRNSLTDVISAWYVAWSCLVQWCLVLFLYPFSQITFMMVMILIANLIWTIQAIWTTDIYLKLQSQKEKEVDP